MRARRWIAALGVLAGLGLALAVGVGQGCLGLERAIVGVMTPEYVPALTAEGGFGPSFDGPDLERPRLGVRLVPVTTGLVQPTDLQFVPGDPALLIALEKRGTARWADLAAGRQGLLFELAVLDDSEMGLLGLAFHPDFVTNGRLFVNATVEHAGEPVTEISEWRVPAGSDLRRTRPARHAVLLRVVQPYPNHDAGQLAFGPDGHLYVGLGDGGWRDDPHGAGQDPSTLLGGMLRLDVDGAEAGRPYRVPADNPFVGREGHRPELWAIGLRNPWRYSFTPDGRLVVADVGQDRWEEVSILGRGDNAGWKIREADHCFEPEEGCRTEGLVDPVWSYGREDGGSITGGYVVTATGALSGRYLVGDFLSGRLWALDLPAPGAPGARATAHALGRFPFLPSTFGRDAEGHVYVAGFRSGTVWRIDPS
jgi:glucose/arabinose dehydrogenase